MEDNIQEREVVMANLSPENQEEYEKDEKDEIKKYVVKIKAMFSYELGHIEPDMIEYLFFSKKNSKVKARMVVVKGRLTAYLKTKPYILEIHKESWQDMLEPIRCYVIKHELLHIDEMGFIKGDGGYKKLIKHDLEDFKSLVRESGVDMEKVVRVFGDGN